jgi:hypothetical protein
MMDTRFLVLAMSTFGVAALVAIAACSSDATPGGTVDAGTGDGTTQGADSGGGGPDAAAETGGGTGKNGDLCDAGAQCASGICFVGGSAAGGDGGGNKSFCSLACDAAAQCPNPPFSSCNNRGFCRIP